MSLLCVYLIGYCEIGLFDFADAFDALPPKCLLAFGIIKAFCA